MKYRIKETITSDVRSFIIQEKTDFLSSWIDHFDACKLTYSCKCRAYYDNIFDASNEIDIIKSRRKQEHESNHPKIIIHKIK